MLWVSGRRGSRRCVTQLCVGGFLGMPDWDRGRQRRAGVPGVMFSVVIGTRRSRGEETLVDRGNCFYGREQDDHERDP